MDNITKSHIRQIKQAMRQNKLVIFAGAGVSKSAGVPLWGELIDELKKELRGAGDWYLNHQYTIK